MKRDYNNLFNLIDSFGNAKFMYEFKAREACKVFIKRAYGDYPNIFERLNYDAYKFKSMECIIVSIEVCDNEIYFIDECENTFDFYDKLIQTSMLIDLCKYILNRIRKQKN